MPSWIGGCSSRSQGNATNCTLTAAMVLPACPSSGELLYVVPPHDRPHGNIARGRKGASLDDGRLCLGGEISQRPLLELEVLLRRLPGSLSSHGHLHTDPGSRTLAWPLSLSSCTTGTIAAGL